MGINLNLNIKHKNISKSQQHNDLSYFLQVMITEPIIGPEMFTVSI